MKRFHFRLEKLLDLRKYHEREWELKLAQITGECINIENEIKSALSDKARAFRERDRIGKLSIDNLINSELYMRRLSNEVDSLEEELAQKEVIRGEVQQSYIEVSKERKVLDKLKEKQAVLFYKKQRVEEQKELDDMNNAAYIRVHRMERSL